MADEERQKNVLKVVCMIVIILLSSQHIMQSEQQNKTVAYLRLAF